ncbi:hypothetical protein [Shimia sp.]|uniref:hypothetical protein n=1 Tax=Shimia sp. TaxID=1954381 RepID=UPI003B8CEA9A
MDAAKTLTEVEVSAELAQMLAAHPLPQGVPDADMSQDEIAQALGVTVNTLGKWLKDTSMSPQFPVVERGGLGKAYVLRLSHCYAWKMHRDDAEKARLRHNRAAIDRLQASFLGVDVGEGEETLSAKDRRALAEADLVQSKAAQMRRQLVRLEEVVELLEGLFKTMRDGVESMPDRLERELNLKAEEVALVERIGSDILDRMAEQIEEAELNERDISDVAVSNQLVI